MTSPTIDADVDAAPPPRGGGDRAPLRVPAVVTVVGLVVAAVGAVIGFWPLATPTQDCGTAASFMIQGRVNVFVNPDNPPEGITPDEAGANNAEPCQERAANRGLIALALVVGGTLAGVFSVITETTIRLRSRLRWRRLHRTSPPVAVFFDPAAPPRSNAPPGPTAPSSAAPRHPDSIPASDLSEPGPLASAPSPTGPAHCAPPAAHPAPGSGGSSARRAHGGGEPSAAGSPDEDDPISAPSTDPERS